MAKKISSRVWTDKDSRQKAVGVVIVLVFALVGIYLLKTSRAASPYATSAATSGTLAGSASIFSNSSASNGQAVQFGSSGTSTVGTSANDIFIWTGCGDIEGLSAAALTAYKNDGIAGFVCEEPGGYLDGMGGYPMTSDLSNPDLACGSTNTTYSQEQYLICSGIVAKVHTAGLKIYYDAWLDNYNNTATPLEPWFNDAEWTGTVEPAISTFASIGKQLGFDGLAMDSESYNTEGLGAGYGQSSIWSWDGVTWNPNTSYAVNAMFNNAGVTYVVTKAYKSGATFGSTDTSSTTVDTETQTQTNTEVKLRGQQLMGWIAAAFPNVQILNFGINFPNTWDSYIAQVDDGAVNGFANTVTVPFWSGMTSQDNFSNISIFDEDFYKGPNIAPSTATTLADGLQYNANSYYAEMSQNFSNWAYDADRVDIAPSIWIDGITGQGATNAPLSVGSATTLMDAYTQWSVGNILMDYAYGNPVTYDYSPFYALFENIAKQTVVETTLPTLTVSSPSGSSTSTTSSTITMSGSSTDPFAIRDVKWTNQQTGTSGAAAMTWVINSGTFTTTYNSQSNWTMTVPLQSGTNKITITAENIHGLTTSQVITVTH